jgi:hypothetical protein
MATRFHLDEHVSPIIAELLRQHGIDVTTSQDAELLGHPDEDQLSFAISNSRTFVTCDALLTRHEVRAIATFGVCYCHPQKYSLREFAEALQIVAECMSEDDLHNHIEFL